MNRRALVLALLGAGVLSTLALLGPRPAGAEDPARALDLIKPSRSKAAHEFSVPALPRGTLRLADFKGKVVFLNFWATWCPPCKEEMPDIERLHQRYSGRGLVVMAVSVDSDGASAVGPFVKEHRLTFRIGLDPKMSTASLYGVRALPSTFLIDRNGTIAYLALGPRKWNSTDAWALVDSLLR